MQLKFAEEMLLGLMEWMPSKTSYVNEDLSFVMD